VPLQINVDPQATSQPVVEDKEQAQMPAPGVAETMREKLKTTAGHAVYKMRKAVVELPYRFCAPCQMRRICTASDSITR
jgi:hypothetical protein